LAEENLGKRMKMGRLRHVVLPVKGGRAVTRQNKLPDVRAQGGRAKPLADGSQGSPNSWEAVQLGCLPPLKDCGTNSQHPPLNIQCPITWIPPLLLWGG